MRAVAILTAAGEGTRLGHALPKALVPLDGEALVARAARSLVASGAVGRLIVTAPAEHASAMGDAVRAVVQVPVDVVAGGSTRQQSVAAGLGVLTALGLDPRTVILVHDAARPLVPAEVVVRVVEAVESGQGAVVPGLAVADTIKQVQTDSSGAVRVRATVDRTTLTAVQTPQGFSAALLVRAHAAAAGAAVDEATAATDDAGLVEALGEPVWVVPGHPDAMKITTARDLALAHALIGAGA